MNLKEHIRHVPDFPKPGILFYDISTLLAHPGAWAATVERLADDVTPYKPDILVGIESRGFLVTAPLAYKLSMPFVMLRKKGKLPGETVDYTYDLEYGTDTVELQKGAVEPGQKVVVMDDLLATGGTMTATVELLRKIGADVKACVCIIELTFLHGRHRLAEHGVPCHSLIEYEE